MNDQKAARLAAIRAANAQKTAMQQPDEPKPVRTETTSPPVVSNNSLRPTAQTTPKIPAPSTPLPIEDPDGAALRLSTVFVMLFAAVIGAFGAVFVLPQWLPGLSASLLGTEPKAYWYLSRSSALVAYSLLWLSMMLGLAITGKLTRIWPGGPTVFDLHQFTGLLALAFGTFHALVLLGDRYINYSLAHILMPFSSTTFRPVWVGLGQVALYGLALVGLSFYIRPWIGRRVWRVIHYLSFGVFLLGLAHGVGSGSDTQGTLGHILYWGSGGSVLLLTSYRILISRAKPNLRSADRVPAPLPV